MKQSWDELLNTFGGLLALIAFFFALFVIVPLISEMAR